MDTSTRKRNRVQYLMGYVPQKQVRIMSLSTNERMRLLQEVISWCKPHIAYFNGFRELGDWLWRKDDPDLKSVLFQDDTNARTRCIKLIENDRRIIFLDKKCGWVLAESTLSFLKNAVPGPEVVVRRPSREEMGKLVSEFWVLQRLLKELNEQIDSTIKERTLWLNGLKILQRQFGGLMEKSDWTDPNWIPQ